MRKAPAVRSEPDQVGRQPPELGDLVAALLDLGNERGDGIVDLVHASSLRLGALQPVQLQGAGLDLGFAVPSSYAGETTGDASSTRISTIAWIRSVASPLRSR